MKSEYSDEEIQMVKEFMQLSAETQARLRRLIKSWLEKSRCVENNKVIPFNRGRKKTVCKRSS